jgi:restriction system protein
MTIREAIRQVLSKGEALTAEEIHRAIVQSSLFEFKSTAAVSIVRTQLRRHCEGIEVGATGQRKEFRQVASGRYALIMD